MRRTILLSLLMLSFTVNAQEFYSNGDCKADFKYEFNPDVMTLVPGAAINFYDITEGNVTERVWDFGDGHTSTEQNPMFVFTYPLGSPNVKINPYRTISLTIVTDSCKSTVSHTINIFEISDTIQQNCKAVFRYYETERDSISETVTIHFDNFSEGKELSYFWQFGNGTTSTEKEPVVKFNQKEQEYKVCLTVTSADSCSDIMCDAVYMHPPVIPTDPECKVAFGYEKKDLLMNSLPSMLVNFYYKSSPEAAEWDWDFGDGTTSNEPNPTHIYYQTVNADSVFSDSIYYIESNPFRTVCLTIKTVDECKVTYCETIQVFEINPEPERCQAYFKYYQPDDIVSIPEVVPIRLVDVSEGDVISRYWKFEDGSVNTEKEPLVMFDIFQPVHKACLTVTFSDSCTSTFCDYVYVNGGIIDTIVVDPVCPYYIKVDGGFPIELSSCAGWASASVYLNDSLVKPEIISWSIGDETPTVEGLCPTETYTVKALMPDGCAVWTNFILSADGTITPVSPINWWLSGERENLYVRSDAGKGLKVEWRLCDGTIVESDSIALDAINCGGDMSNMIVKDSLGNVVYSEMIALKGTTTGIEDSKIKPEVKLWPNPVSNKLNIRYSGKYQNKIGVEICDIMGKSILKEIFYDISNGYEFNVNTESLKSGIYILRISSESELLLSKKISRQ